MLKQQILSILRLAFFSEGLGSVVSVNILHLSNFKFLHATQAENCFSIYINSMFRIHSV